MESHFVSGLTSEVLSTSLGEAGPCRESPDWYRVLGETENTRAMLRQTGSPPLLTGLNKEQC